MATFRITTDQGTFEVKGAESEEAAYAAFQEMMGQPQKQEEKGFLERAGDWLAGTQRREDIPTAPMAGLGLSPKKASELTALLATTASDDRLMRGITKIEPNAQFDKDEFGNLIAIMPQYDEQGTEIGRRRFYPNPRGLDVTDVLPASGAAALGSALAAGAGLLGLPTGGFLGGATLGGTEAAMSELASSQQTDSPYQFSDIPFGIIAGGISGKAADVIGRWVASARGNQSVMLPNGQFRPEVVAALRSAGLDPDKVSQEVAQSLSRRVAASIDPMEAGRLAQAETLPVPVPMTRGDITGSAGQQLFEDMARKGAYGQGAESIMQGQRSMQQEALRQNIPAIQQIIAGTSPVIAASGEGGAAASAALAARRTQEQAAATALYNVARSSGVAAVDPAASAGLVTDIRATLSGFNPRTAPNAYAFADDFEDTLAKGSVEDLFAWREQVTNAATVPGPDGKAMGEMLLRFDAAMGDLVDRALISGDAAAVERWGKAISNYKTFAQTWKSKGGILNRLTTEQVRDGSRNLVVPPEAAANYIFGAGTANLITQPAMARDLLTLKKTLPTQEWDMLRQEAFLKLVQAGEGANQSGQRMFSGVKFKKALEDMMTKNPTSVRAIFTPDEVKMLNQFGQVAARATGGAVNSSNTAAAASGLLQALASSIGKTNAAQFITRLVGMNMLRNAYGSTRAFSAMTDLVTPPRAGAVPAGALGGAAASGATLQQPVGEQIRRSTGFPIGVQ